LELTFLSVEFGVVAGLKRYYGKGHMHFVTFRCYQQLLLLGDDQPKQGRVEEAGLAPASAKDCRFTVKQ